MSDVNVSLSPALPSNNWKHQLHIDHPAWAPYRGLLAGLHGARIPKCSQLQALLPAQTRTTSGQPVRFFPAQQLASADALGYEEEIAASGRVSTRANNLHDLCNALVWARFPQLKAAMNARHMAAPPAPKTGRRGQVRDALTLFDECGLLVTSPNPAPLEALARHDWHGLFGVSGEGWSPELRVYCVGHANLEKLQQPYKSMTGRCLLLHTPGARPEVHELDHLMATLWQPGGALSKPADLAPLPHAGIPDWWLGAEQDARFYADSSVFRPARPDRSATPIWSA